MSALLSMIRRASPEWQRHAACAGEPITVFFPERGGSTKRAYELCGRCPVRESCLADAMTDPELDAGGIRGGMSADARKARRRLEAKRGAA